MLGITAFAVDFVFVLCHCVVINTLVASFTFRAALVKWHAESNGFLVFVDGLSTAGTVRSGTRRYSNVGISRLVTHFSLLHAVLSPSFRAESTSSSAETVPLGSEAFSVAGFTVHQAIVGCYCGTVQQLVTYTTGKAELVPFLSRSDPLLGGIHRFTALRALGLFWGFERHIAKLGGLYQFQ